MFHRLRAPPTGFAAAANQRNCVAPERFAALLRWLRRAGIEALSLDDAAARLESGDRRRFVCLTFDDGYRDNHDDLLPLAVAHQAPVTVYVTPGLIDGTSPLWWYALDALAADHAALRLPLPVDTLLPTTTPAQKQAAFDRVAGFLLQCDGDAAALVTAAMAKRYGVDFPALARTHMMDWEMVRRLAASPLVTIGAHGMTHAPLARRPASEAQWEMEQGRAWLERETGRPVHHLAYPFGTHAAAGGREVALAKELGFRTAVTSRPGHLHPRYPPAPHAWPRVGVGPGDTAMRLRLKLVGAAALRQALRW